MRTKTVLVLTAIAAAASTTSCNRLKLGSSDWTPVGEEMFHKAIPGKGGTAALVICDADGNSKAMSGWFPVHKTGEFSETLTQRGIPVFAGDVSLPI